MRDIWLVARFELFESLKSTRALVIFILFIVGALFMSEGCVRAEKNITETVTENLGSTATVMLSSEEMRVNMYKDLIHDDEIAESLAEQPLVGISFVFLSMMLLPFMIVILTSDTISKELANGSIRFSLFRTSRIKWALGKLFGQTILIEAGVIAAAIAVTLFTMFRLQGFNSTTFVPWITVMCVKLMFYAFAYIGIIVGLSQVTRSANVSRALGFLTLIALYVSFGILTYHSEQGNSLAQTLINVIPTHHTGAIWAVDLETQLKGFGAFAAIGLGSFLSFYSVLVMRDA